jgi:hypothetical protein
MAESYLVRKAGGGAKLNGTEIDVVLNQTVEPGDFLQWSDNTVSSLQLVSTPINAFNTSNSNDDRSYDVKLVDKRFYFVDFNSSGIAIYRLAELTKQQSSPEIKLHIWTNMNATLSFNTSPVTLVGINFLNDLHDGSILVHRIDNTITAKNIHFSRDFTLAETPVNGNFSDNFSYLYGSSFADVSLHNYFGFFIAHNSSNNYIFYAINKTRSSFDVNNATFAVSGNSTKLMPIRKDGRTGNYNEGSIRKNFLIKGQTDLKFISASFSSSQSNTAVSVTRTVTTIGNNAAQNIKNDGLAIITGRFIFSGMATSQNLYYTRTNNSTYHLELAKVSGDLLDSSTPVVYPINNFSFSSNAGYYAETFILDLTESKTIPETQFDRRKIVFYVDNRLHATNGTVINASLLNENNAVLQTIVITPSVATNRLTGLKAFKYDEDTVVVFWSQSSGSVVYYQIIKLISKTEKAIRKDYFVGVALQGGTAGQTIKMIRYI